MKITVKNRSNQQLGHLGSYLQSFLPFAQKRLGFNKPPCIYFDSDVENSKKVLGKTGYYNPETHEVVIYIDNRHPKDVLRSLSHELVHHSQNCRGDLNPEIAGGTEPGYAQNNPHMRKMESEAYEKGNLCMRDWEDSVKIQLQETNYYHTKGDSHKMATYDQLKEELTQKIVKQLKEKFSRTEDTIEESEEELEETAAKRAGNEDRDTGRDRMHADRMHESEEIDEGESDDDGAVVNEEEELQDRWSNYIPPEIEFGDASSSRARGLKYGERDQIRRRKKAKEETVEETASNDQWYQSELFESLKKRWTK